MFQFLTNDLSELCYVHNRNSLTMPREFAQLRAADRLPAGDSLFETKYFHGSEKMGVTTMSSLASKYARFIVQGTIEERIVDLHRTKRDLADSLLEGTNMSSKLSTEELLKMIQE